MTFTLPGLPYQQDDLSPYISKETVNVHYNKHHKGYVDKLNNLIKGTEFENLSNADLITIIKKTHNSNNNKIFNNAGQVWNHTFYWNSMKKDGGGKPLENSVIAKKIESDLGGFDNFTKSFSESGENQFGSGWTWLVYDNEKLKITSTSNAESPLVFNQIPLLAMDVWEHAYYLDQKNVRKEYITLFLKHLINWDFAEANLRKALNP